MLLKLRHDWYEEQGGKPSLRAFHDALLAHGSAPFWALRKLMLDGHNDVGVWNRQNLCRSTNISAKRARTASK